MRALALFLAAAVSLAPAEAATRRRIVSRGTGSDSPFGVFVNTISSSDQARIAAALDLAHTAGIQWLRVQFSWSAIQPSNAITVDFSSLDPIVARANQNNQRILGILGYATQWSTTAPSTETRLAQREHYPPASYDAWSRYIFSTVSRYKSSVHHWEVWNE